MSFSWSQRARRSYATDPFIDLLFNALLGFAFLFVVALMFMNPIAKQGIIDPKAEYLITISWPDHNADGIDTWVEDPSGNIVWFRNREAGLVHLDRDDRGALNDTITVNNRTIRNPLNQEVTTIRGVVPGEYVVNVHYYASASRRPVRVSAEVAKVNPSLEIVYYGVEILEKRGVEKTAVRFVIGADGEVSDINHIPKKLVTL